MSNKIFPRLLGVLGIFAVLAAIYWAIVKFAFATQSGLAPDLVTRLDGDPSRVQAYLDEMIATLSYAGIASLVVAALLASLWLIMLDRSPPHGDRSARAKRRSWSGLMLLALAVGGIIFWLMVIGAPVAALLASSVPLYATIIGLVLVALGYWLSTGLFAPASTKVAVPGGGMFAR